MFTADNDHLELNQHYSKILCQIEKRITFNMETICVIDNGPIKDSAKKLLPGIGSTDSTSTVMKTYILFLFVDFL